MQNSECKMQTVTTRVALCLHAEFGILNYTR